MNYFSSLTFRGKIKQLGHCRFMDSSEFNGVEKLKGKKITIIGCGAQGFHQGLNLRDSGLDVTYALLDDEISKQLPPGSWLLKTISISVPMRRPFPRQTWF